MSFLDPIFHNNTGTVYAVRSSYDTDEPFHKVQLQIGDIAILMYKKEIDAFLSIIRAAKKNKDCHCKNCKHDKAYKIIKCDTPMANIRFKVTKKNLDDLEDLVMSVFFQEEFNSILINNEISS